jgi:hypothetical protein
LGNHKSSHFEEAENNTAKRVCQNFSTPNEVPSVSQKSLSEQDLLQTLIQDQHSIKKYQDPNI